MLEGALAASKEKHAAEMGKCAKLERQVDEMRSELRQATSNNERLEGTAAQGKQRALTLEDKIRALKSEQARSSEIALDQQDGFKKQVSVMQDMVVW